MTEEEGQEEEDENKNAWTQYYSAFIDISMVKVLPLLEACFVLIWYFVDVDFVFCEVRSPRSNQNKLLKEIGLYQQRFLGRPLKEF